MLKHIFNIILLLAAGHISHAQQLQHLLVEITKTNDTSYMAILDSYTAHTIIVKPISSNCTNKPADTLPYTDIKLIVIHRNSMFHTYKVACTTAGFLIGSKVGDLLSPPPKTNPDTSGFVKLDLDLTGCGFALYAGAGACIGFSVGSIIEVARRKKTVRIYAREDRFKAFIEKYKERN